jgi:hypothetical protein
MAYIMHQSLDIKQTTEFQTQFDNISILHGKWWNGKKGGVSFLFLIA